ncbi:MAG TPA: DUF2339 domain-containing protein, partial [Puia sp.]|nr:DUF2339 domain-containing protein [Puia sp.]
PSAPLETEPFTPAHRPQPSYQPIPRSGPPIQPPPPPPPKPDFFDRHPDLEKFIGENLISKIGIAILVLAIAFFVKYAIDNDWIGPVGRVGVGLLCGGILVGIAHWLRNSYKAFSSVLVGGGIAVFYFTIALAYHQYALFGQTTAFIIMLFITAFAVVLSLLYDRQELAIIALVGGFVTPFLVSTGSGNYKVLFSYLLILNTGLLVIAYNKAWRLLNMLAFGFTAILYASWLLSLPYDTATDVYTGGFCFATAFYLLFFVINIANNIRENKKFIASDFCILLANTCLYFGAGLYLLVQMHMTQYQGLFSASMSVLNLAISYFLFRTKKVDTNILYLLIGITLSFISLTAPIQLHGHYITLFWASESVVLYWLFIRSRIKIIRLASAAVWLAMLVSLVWDWINVYALPAFLDPTSGASAALPIIFNKGFLTSAYCAICCFALFRLRRNASSATFSTGSDDPLSFLAPAKFFVVAGGLLLFVSGGLETWHQFSYYYPGTNWAGIYLLLYVDAFLLAFAFSSGRVKDADPQPLNALLLGACLVLYLIAIPFVFGTQQDFLEHRRPGDHFIAHWAADVLIGLILCQFISWQRTNKIHLEPGGFAWVIGIMIVIFLSTEGLLLVNAVYYSNDHLLEDLQRVYIKTGLPILWGLCSFAYMWLGMRHKFKPLRILSLVLFSVTLLKLFLYDIRNIPIAGKIAAFFCLGVLLLVVSFMYQRLKKIIIEDEGKKTI